MWFIINIWPFYAERDSTYSATILVCKHALCWAWQYLFSYNTCLYACSMLSVTVPIQLQYLFVSMLYVERDSTYSATILVCMHALCWAWQYLFSYNTCLYAYWMLYVERDSTYSATILVCMHALCWAWQYLFSYNTCLYACSMLSVTVPIQLQYLFVSMLYVERDSTYSATILVCKHALYWAWQYLFSYNTCLYACSMLSVTVPIQLQYLFVSMLYVERDSTYSATILVCMHALCWAWQYLFSYNTCLYAYWMLYVERDSTYSATILVCMHALCWAWQYLFSYNTCLYAYWMLYVERDSTYSATILVCMHIECSMLSVTVPIQLQYLFVCMLYAERDSTYSATILVCMHIECSMLSVTVPIQLQYLFVCILNALCWAWQYLFSYNTCLYTYCLLYVSITIMHLRLRVIPHSTLILFG